MIHIRQILISMLLMVGIRTLACHVNTMGIYLHTAEMIYIVDSSFVLWNLLLSRSVILKSLHEEFLRLMLLAFDNKLNNLNGH